MIFLKSKEEIELMRIAGKIVAQTHAELKPYIAPGISTKQLDTIAENFILKQGAKPSFKGYYGFPASICTSINNVLIHGIPDNTILKEGDIISIDIGAEYKGYHGDSAWSYPVGKISLEAQRLLEVTEASLYFGLEQAKVGNRIGDISYAIQNYVERFGYSIPYDFTGHGIGRKLHEEPIVPNIGEKGFGPLIKKGLAIAVEPMVNQGMHQTITLNDDWTVITYDGKLAAHYEHTIVVLENGIEILTKL